MGKQLTYRQVMSLLRTRIDGLPDGTKLPTVLELATEYGATKSTVSRAVGDLQAAGLLVARRGAGIFVRHYQPIARSSPARLARNRWGAGYAVQDAETDGRVRVADVHVDEVPAPAWAAGPLGLPPDGLVVSRGRKFVIDGRAVQLATSYLPVDIARGTRLAYSDTGPGGSYARLAELGHAPARFTEYVRSRMPDPVEVEALRLVGGPVLEITRHAVTGSGRCVEVNRMVLDSDVYLLDYTFDAG